MSDTPMTDAEREAYRKGLLRAAEMCELKAEEHKQYVGESRYTSGNYAHAATCGRRDECANLAYEIRAEAEKVTRKSATITDSPCG